MSDIFDALITDRADINSYYNLSDLNRVEEAVTQLSQKMSNEGYYVSPKAKTPTAIKNIVDPKNPNGEHDSGYVAPAIKVNPNIWNVYDIPTDAEMKRYLNNVLGIRRQLSKMQMPLPDTMQGLNYVDANNIENVLKVGNKIVNAIKSNFRRCGLSICGGDEFVDEADLMPYVDYFGILTWRRRPPMVDEDGILDLSYAVFRDGILEDI